jgi:hypothetical protein
MKNEDVRSYKSDDPNFDDSYNTLVMGVLYDGDFIIGTCSKRNPMADLVRVRLSGSDDKRNLKVRFALLKLWKALKDE